MSATSTPPLKHQPDDRPSPGAVRTGRSRSIVIVKTGRTYDELARRRGDFEDWTSRGLGMAPRDLSIVDVEDGLSLPPREDVAGAVVTDSAREHARELMKREKRRA